VDEPAHRRRVDEADREVGDAVDQLVGVGPRHLLVLELLRGHPRAQHREEVRDRHARHDAHDESRDGERTDPAGCSDGHDVRVGGRVDDEPLPRGRDEGGTGLTIEPDSAGPTVLRDRGELDRHGVTLLRGDMGTARSNWP